MAEGRRDRGAINFVKVFSFLGVCAVLYLSYIFVPVTIDHYFGVRKVVRTACNIAYAQRAEAPVRDALKKGFRDLHLENQTLNDDGTVTTTPVELTDDNIDTIEITKDPPAITVEIHYSRSVVWPWMKKQTVKDYTSAHTEPLDVIKF